MSDESQKLLNILLGGKTMPIGEDVLNALLQRYSMKNEINHEILAWLKTYMLTFLKEIPRIVEKLEKRMDSLETKVMPMLAK